MFDHKSRTSAKPRKQPVMGGRVQSVLARLTEIWASPWGKRGVLAVPVVVVLAAAWSAFDPDSILPINTVQIETFINYWFRHVWQYTLPTYPALILAATLVRFL